MLNKILIFSVILFNLIIFNVYSNDQITFDVSEIEILDGGNKIVGKKRGTITTNDGIIIEANNFIFNKIENILEAEGDIIIKDKINNYNFSAQNIIYKKNKERVVLKGKVGEVHFYDPSVLKFETGKLYKLKLSNVSDSKHYFSSVNFSLPR